MLFTLIVESPRYRHMMEVYVRYNYVDSVRNADCGRISLHAPSTCPRHNLARGLVDSLYIVS